MPVITPDEEPTVATAGLPLVQVPPAGLPVRVNDAPTHTRANAPVLIPRITGTGFTVTAVVIKQPVGNV